MATSKKPSPKKPSPKKPSPKKPSPKKPSPKKPSAKKPLPPALRARAKALHEASSAAHLKAAHDALARARAALSGAERGLYEMALALRDLDEPKLLAAIGYPTLYAAAEQELGLSRSTVDRLRRAADAVDAERFARLGHTRINAMLALADATPFDDTDAILAEKTVPLWEDGPLFKVKGASTRSIDEAAAQARAHAAKASPPTDRRGNRVTAADAALATRLTRALAKHAAGASVTARATKPGAGARFVVDGLDADGARALLAALTAR